MPVKIFLSYAHEDEKLKMELEKQLSLLKRQGLIDVWHDRDISAGTEWEQEVNKHLNTADIILLLVSPDFIISDYCYEREMKRAIERNAAKEALVIPIVLRPADWHSAPFGRLQALPKDSKPVTNWTNPDEAFLDIAQGIRKAVENLLNDLPSVTLEKRVRKFSSQRKKKVEQPYILQCPYRGLSIFREEDEPFFFGRDTFTQQLVDAVHRRPLVAIIGSSGSGKSSVVFAGLIPTLRREGNWSIASFRPSSRPFRSLTVAMMPLLEPHLSERERLIESNELAEQLQEGKLELQDVVELIVQKQAKRHFLLIVDQFEELYTLTNEPTVRERFLDILISTVQASSNLDFLDFNIALTLRADFVGQVLTYRPFADALQYADLKLGPMNTQELRDVIRKPAQKLDIKIEDGLTERILSEVQQGTVRLPLLEFALTLLWNNQKEGKITHTAYEEIGGVEKALADHAERFFAELSDIQQARAQWIFLQLVRFGEGTEDTRRIATRAEIGEDNWNLALRLSSAHARLVVSGRDETFREETIEIAHEALIRGWKRLGKWIKDNREFRTWQERLRSRISEWKRATYSHSELLRGFVLTEAETWLIERNLELSQAERDFIEASREQQIQEEERWKKLYKDAELERTRLELIISSMAEGLLITDARGAITSLNQSAQHLLSEAQIDLKQDIPLRTLATVSNVHWLHQLAAIVDKALVNQVVMNQELIAGEHSDTVPLTLSISAAPLHDAGEAQKRPTGVVAVLNDITSNKQIEKLKDEFVSVVSHELRTPLTAIKGYTQHLVRRLERRLHIAKQAQTQPQPQKGTQGTQAAEQPESYDLRSLYIVQSQAEHLERLVNDLLDLSRVQWGHLDLHTTTFNLADLLAASIRSTQISAEQHTITLDIKIRETKILADEPRIGQVVGNILDNAVKYSPNGGPVMVSLEEQDGDYLISVSDQGIGISPEYVDHIFERFYRVRNAANHHYSGIGLGLYVAKAIVERHGGRIWFSNNPGLGSTFCFTLPQKSMTNYQEIVLIS